MWIYLKTILWTLTTKGDNHNEIPRQKLSNAIIIGSFSKITD